MTEPAADGQEMDPEMGDPDPGGRKVAACVLATHVLEVVRVVRACRPGMTVDELEGFLLLAVADAEAKCRRAGVEPPGAGWERAWEG